MKFLFSFFFFLFFGFCSAQTSIRVQIEGKIIVPAGFDAGGIAIYNETDNHGTVSTEEGNFNLLMKVGDSLIFSALQFKELKLAINQEIIDSGYLKVQIFEGVNELPEIVIKPHNLTGNLKEDMKNIEVVNIAFPTMSAAEIKEYQWNFQPDAQTSPVNAAMGQSTGMPAGANPLAIIGTVLNILLPDPGPKVKKHKNRERSRKEKILLEREVRSSFDDLFFKEYLHIPATKISSFLSFCEENGFDQDLLRKEKKLELIQFLMQQSKEFNQVKNNI